MRAMSMQNMWTHHCAKIKEPSDCHINEYHKNRNEKGKYCTGEDEKIFHSCFVSFGVSFLGG